MGRLQSDKSCQLLAWVVLLTAAALEPACLRATTFYVSPDGSDANSGTSPAAPWASGAKVDQARFQAGDRILFRRGGEWHGQLEASSDGTPANPIVYSDYGDRKLEKPIFEGSDYVARGAFKAIGKGVYSFPVSASAGGQVYGVYLNADTRASSFNIPLLAATSGGADMPADSFFVDGDTVFINTRGADSRNPGVAVDPTLATTAVSVGDRATGQDPAQGVIASDAHSNLVFSSLIGRETAQVGAGGKVIGGIIDAYVVRVQGGSNVTLSNDDAFYGGKHIFGAIDTTGFVATNDTAQGAIDGVAGNQLPYGNATALVSYADAGQTGDTFRWINCTVKNYSGSQPAFLTHNDGSGSIKSILLQNLNSIGSPVAFEPGPGVTITYKGGSIQNNNLSAYSSPGVIEMIDGVKVTGSGSDILVYGNTTVQNCMVLGSGQSGGIQSSGPNNVIRFNTVAMQNGAVGIHVQKDATGTKVLGNIVTGTTNALQIDGGATTCALDYDFFDGTGGAPQFGINGVTMTIAQLQAAGEEKHGTVGDPMFEDAARGKYGLKFGSRAKRFVPTVAIPDIGTDGPGTGWSNHGPWDAGAPAAGKPHE
jgi:hypothetical protein